MSKVTKEDAENALEKYADLDQPLKFQAACEFVNLTCSEMVDLLLESEE